MRFAHMKRILRLDRFRLRGLKRRRQARSTAYSNRAEPEAARQTSLPCPHTSGGNLPSIGAQMDTEAETRESANNGAG